MQYVYLVLTCVRHAAFDIWFQMMFWSPDLWQQIKDGPQNTFFCKHKSHRDILRDSSQLF